MSDIHAENFHLWEFTESRTAARKGIDNSPDPTHIRNLNALCRLFLQPVRDRYSSPILITSGYRCPELNRAVGGVEDSLHKTGKAADFKVVGYEAKTVFSGVDLIEGIQYSELILYPSEKRLHVGISNMNTQNKYIERDGEYEPV